MRKYCPIAHKHQLTDVDQRLGQERVCAVYSLLLDITHQFAGSPSLQIHCNYRSRLKGPVHLNYKELFFVSLYPIASYTDGFG